MIVSGQSQMVAGLASSFYNGVFPRILVYSFRREDSLTSWSKYRFTEFKTTPCCNNLKCKIVEPKQSGQTLKCFVSFFVGIQKCILLKSIRYIIRDNSPQINRQHPVPIPIGKICTLTWVSCNSISRPICSSVYKVNIEGWCLFPTKTKTETSGDYTRPLLSASKITLTR